MIIPLLFAAVLLPGSSTAPDAPAREPQLAVRGTTVALTYGAGREIFFSLSRDGGTRFSKPVAIASGPVLPLNRHRGPRVVFAGNAIVISAVVGNRPAEGSHAHGLPMDGDLLVWRSMDEGKTWTKAARVNDVAGAPTEGLHTLASDAKGNLFAAWLDKRGQGTQLYGARSRDGGLTWSPNVQIYASPEGTICECCHPSAVISPSGEVLVMFRNWLQGARDMYLARSRDGLHFGSLEKMGRGTWQLNGCPMDGGGLVLAKDRVVSAWRREGELFLASPGEREISLGKGIDVSIAAGGHGVYAIWTTPEGIVVHHEGKKIQISSSGAFPSVAAFANGVVAAWEENGRISVQTLR